MKQTFTILIILSLLALAGCNTGTDKAKELELKEKELELKEKELELAEKDSDEDDSEEPVAKPKKKITKPKKETTSKSSDEKDKSTSEPSTTPDPNKKEFFVILGVFKQSQTDKVNEAVRKARKGGLSVKIIDTAKYPAMRNGLFAVVMGPFSKPVAEHELQKARLVENRAYVKSGY